MPTAPPPPRPATAHPPLKKGAERRQATRRRVNSQAELLVCPASSRTATIKVNVLDVSETGVGIVHNEPLPLGQKYVVKEQSIIPKKQPCLYTVVRADPMPNGAYSIGLHASHLMGLDCAGKTGHAKTGAMAKLLILAIIMGGLAAVVWTSM